MSFRKNKKSTTRIAMIGQKHVPSREGGVEIVVWELARRLRDRGYLVECYNRSGYHLHAKDYEKIKGMPGHYYSGIRILTIPTFRSSKLNAIVYSTLATIRALFGQSYDSCASQVGRPSAPVPCSRRPCSRPLAPSRPARPSRSTTGRGRATRPTLRSSVTG